MSTTFQRNRLYRYRSPMGAIGAGFLIEFAGREQHSVAWPDRPAQRYKDDELAELGIKCYVAEPEPESTEPNSPPVSEPAQPSADPAAPSQSVQEGAAEEVPAGVQSGKPAEYTGAGTHEQAETIETWLRDVIENGTTPEAVAAFSEEQKVNLDYLQWRIDHRHADPFPTEAEQLKWAEDMEANQQDGKLKIPGIDDNSPVSDWSAEGIAGRQQGKTAAKQAEEKSKIPEFAFKPDDTEANNIREYLRTFPLAENQEVIGALNKFGMQVSSSQVSAAKKQLARLAKKEQEATAAAQSDAETEGDQL